MTGLATRRSVLRSVGGLGAASVLAPSVRFARAQQPVCERISIGDWQRVRPHVQSLDRALRIMKQMDPSHPHSLAWQANNHARLFRTIHQSWNFFPWHRAQLLFFEAIVRDLSGDRNFALPYWDPTESNTAVLPPWLFQGPFASARNPGVERLNVYRDRLDRKWGAMPARMDEPQFTVFGGGPPVPGIDRSGSIEHGTHNIIHNQIGGVMGGLASPGDPIFWLHHCNIDRMWATWQYRLNAGTAASPRYPQSWRTDAYVNQFTGAPRSAVPLTPSFVRLADTIDYARLGYAYDALYPGILFQQAPDATETEAQAKLPDGNKTLARSRQQAAALAIGAPVTWSVDVPLRLPLNPGRAHAVRAWSQIESAYLTVDFEGDGLQQYYLQTYITAPGAPPPGPDTQGFVETIVPKGMQHEHDPGHMAKASYEINVTDALLAALARGSGNNVAVTIAAGPLGTALNLSRTLSVTAMTLNVSLSEWGWQPR